MSTGTFDRRRLLSRPLGVWWAGWQSDTFRLQSEGWELAVEMEFNYDRYRLLMKHGRMKLYAVTDALQIESMAFSNPYASREPSEVPVFHVHACAPSLQTQLVHGIDFRNFQRIDATPQMVTSEIRRVEDTNIFAVVGQTEQVLIDQADMTVVDHLEAIKALQSQKQRDIRDRILKDPQAPQRQTPRLHLVAQLVHYAEAA